MSSISSDLKKLTDLRVVDLRVELEKRGLDKNGIKASLIERLSKALKEEGEDPDTYTFDLCGTLKSITTDVVEVACLDESSATENESITKTNVDIEVEDNEDSLKLILEDDEVSEHEKTSIKSEISIESKPEQSNQKPIDDNQTDPDLQTERIESSSISNDGNDESTANEIQSTTIQNDAKLTSTQSQDDAKLIQIESQNDGKSTTIQSLEDAKSTSIQSQDDTISTTIESQDDAKMTTIQEDDIKDDESKNDKTDDVPNKTEPKQENPILEDIELECEEFNTKGSEEKESTTAAVIPKKGDKESGRSLWVSGLSTKTRATDLKQLFSKYGKVIGAKIVANARSPSSKCFGFVLMASASDAEKCIGKCKRLEIHGRVVIVDKSRQMDTRTSNDRKAERSSRGRENSKDRKPRRSPRRSETKHSSDKDRRTSKRKSEDPAKVEEKKDEKKGDDTKKEDEKDKSRERSVHSKKSYTSRKDESRSFRRSSPRAVLSFRQIRDERDRERQRFKMLNNEKRKQREEQQRVRELERRNKEEASRLERERQRLRMEREMLQQEKAQLLRMERKKIEQEQIEIKKKIEEARRAVKRPHHDDRRDQYDERKRMHRYDMHQVMEFAKQYKREEKSRVDVRMQRDAREDIRAARDERERVRLREEIRAREDFAKRDRGDFAPPPPPRLSGSTSTQIKYSDSRQYSDDPRLAHELLRRGEALVAATMSMRSNSNSGNNIGKDLRYVEVGNPHDIMPNTYPGELTDNRRGVTSDHDHHRSHRNYDIKDYDRSNHATSASGWHNNQQIMKPFNNPMQQNQGNDGGQRIDSKKFDMNMWMKGEQSSMLWGGGGDSNQNPARYDRRHMERR